MSGFRIKSSHPFVNPSPVEEEDDESSVYSLAVPPKPVPPSTNTISDVRTGSSQGMAIRTSVTGMADYY